MRLCLERILPRDRAVEFALPPIKSAADMARAMKAVTAALAGGLITPSEAQAIARVFTTLVQIIETSDFDQRLQVLETRQAEKPAEPAEALAVFKHCNLKRSPRCRCSGLSYSSKP